MEITTHYTDQGVPYWQAVVPPGSMDITCGGANPVYVGHIVSSFFGLAYRSDRLGEVLQSTVTFETIARIRVFPKDFLFIKFEPMK